MKKPGFLKPRPRPSTQRPRFARGDMRFMVPCAWCGAKVHGKFRFQTAPREQMVECDECGRVNTVRVLVNGR